MWESGGGIDNLDNTLVNLRPFISGVMNFVLECDVGGGNWVTIQKFSNPNDWSFGAVNPDNGAGSATKFTGANMRYAAFADVDPRTLRMGMGFVTKTLSLSSPTGQFWNKTLAWSPTDTAQQYALIRSSNGSSFSPNISPNSTSNKNNSQRLADNRGTGTAMSGVLYTDPCYRDPDGIQRYGDAIWNPADLTKGVFPMSPIASRPQDRPIILNRPFQTVGDMGYAFRDLPFKSLDFSTSRSADAALLDLFCINEGDATVGVSAGLFNLNTANPEVLSAVLSGVTLTDLDPANNRILSTTADTTAQALVTLTSGTGTGQGPLLDKAEVATRFGENAAITQVAKGQKEAIIRSLAGIGQTRTWNLLIDVIAQSGRFSPAATALNQFTVEGEQRYWLHVAIDRYTGQVLDQQLEAVKN